MSNEVRVAVERLRTKWVATSVTGPTGSPKSAWVSDLAIVADAYLNTIQKKEAMNISAVHLLREGTENGPKQDAVVLIEVEGKWVEIIREDVRGNFSHICEEGGMKRRVDESR